MAISLDGHHKSVESIRRVADGEQVYIPDEVYQKVAQSRKLVEQAVNEARRVYGITTGFGKFADVAISRDDLKQLQMNLVMSHAAGVGQAFSPREVRAAMFLRANALARGMSGVRMQVIEMFRDMLNKGVVPHVPEKGSVGASGDLAPLSHIALVLAGKGLAFYNGELLPGNLALARAGLEPIEFEAKEGLALTNGVQMSAAVLALATDLAQTLCTAADIISSLTGQALWVICDAYDAGIVDLRPHAGAREVAGNLRKLLSDSGLTSRTGEFRVQDAYVLRCIPQVHGAVRQAVSHVRSVVEIESGSATDNPLVLEDGRILSGGNFHGQPIAIAGDYLGLSLCSLGNISERRIARLMDPVKSGLPAFLTSDGGLNSGLMLLQYTAAALASECKVLAHPASVDSIPTSADQEDHVSMSPIACRKARDIAANVAQILAIEYISACQALEFRDRTRLSKAGKAAYELLRSRVSAVSRDREMAGDLQAAYELIVSGQLQQAVESTCGKLN